VPTPAIRGAGVLTGLGTAPEGGAPAPAAGPAALVPVATPALAGDRFRRATRECLLAVAAARAAVADAGLDGSALSGPRTGILYVGATGYAPANRSFLEDESSTTLHFPYTSPSAVPGEVTIELGVRGPCVNLVGGGPAALEALWWAARWLDEGGVDRVLVLAVEVLQELRDLLARARRLYAGPLVEGAACLLLERGGSGTVRWGVVQTGPTTAGRDVIATLERVLDGERPGGAWSGAAGSGRARAEARVLARSGAAAGRAAGGGEALALGPLLALAEARRGGAAGPWLLTATWRTEYGALLWGAGPARAVAPSAGSAAGP
jgi:hypothetical protein